ncbi:protein kinase, ATP binding site-containing protein [Tanacetum coccineum]
MKSFPSDMSLGIVVDKVKVINRFPSDMSLGKKPYHKQAKGKLTDSIFNEMLEWLQYALPESKGYKFPPSYYAIKKTFKTIGLGYESIHACEHDCCLFSGEVTRFESLSGVVISRWKDSDTPGKKDLGKLLLAPRRFLRKAHKWRSSREFNGDTDHRDPPKEYPRDVILAQHARLLTRLKSHDCHIMMQRLLPYGLQNYLPDNIAKPIIELCSLFKQLCSATLMEDDMFESFWSWWLKYLCELGAYILAFFDIMIHLPIHLALEALEGGPIHPRWMFHFGKIHGKKLKG